MDSYLLHDANAGNNFKMMIMMQMMIMMKMIVMIVVYAAFPPKVPLRFSSR